MTEKDRPRGVLVYPMPEEVCGPFDRYALAVRDINGELELRMVHTEGVAYLVKNDKPWTWNDYDPSQRLYTVEELMELVDSTVAVDLADWVRQFGARLESNFYQVYAWCNEEPKSSSTACPHTEEQAGRVGYYLAWVCSECGHIEKTGTNLSRFTSTSGCDEGQREMTFTQEEIDRYN